MRNLFPAMVVVGTLLVAMEPGLAYEVPDVSTSSVTPLAGVASLLEGFDSVSTLTTNGWALVNNSQPNPNGQWAQGIGSILSSQDYIASGGQGNPNAYVQANSTLVGNSDPVSGAGGSLSVWLITPELDLSQGGSFSFYTRTLVANTRGEQLQVYLSTSGASTDVGTTQNSLGVFTTALTTIGTNIQGGTSYPGTGIDDGQGNSSPDAWVQYTVNVAPSAIGTGSGRVGFRYFATNSGENGDQGFFVGVDTVNYTAIPEPTVTGALLVGGGLLAMRRRKGKVQA